MYHARAHTARHSFGFITQTLLFSPPKHPRTATPPLLEREVQGGGGLRDAEGVARLRGELVVAAAGQPREDDVHLFIGCFLLIGWCGG